MHVHGELGLVCATAAVYFDTTAVLATALNVGAVGHCQGRVVTVP